MAYRFFANKPELKNEPCLYIRMWHKDKSLLAELLQLRTGFKAPVFYLLGMQDSGEKVFQGEFLIRSSLRVL